MSIDTFLLAIIVVASVGLAYNAATWPLAMTYIGASTLYLGLFFHYAIH